MMSTEEYIDLFNKLYDQAKPKKDKTLIALSLLREISLDERSLFIAEEQRMKKMPTAKQLMFMMGNGIEIPEYLTRKEASDLIDRYKQGKQ